MGASYRLQGRMGHVGIGEKKEEFHRGDIMCPVCIASTAAMAAGAGSTGGVLAVCIGKLRKCFRANGLGLFRLFLD